MAERTKFICTNCGAEDYDNGNNPPVPQALICSKCKAGRGMSVGDQIMRGEGMLTEATIAQFQSAQ